MPALLKPMSEFDPTEPAMIHDARNDRVLAWSPDLQESYHRHARAVAPGVVAFDGLLLDGWMDDAIGATLN